MNLHINVYHWSLETNVKKTKWMSSFELDVEVSLTESASVRCFLDMLPVRVRNWKPFLGSVRFSQSREELNCENTRLFDVGSCGGRRASELNQALEDRGGGGHAPWSPRSEQVQTLIKKREIEQKAFHGLQLQLQGRHRAVSFRFDSWCPQRRQQKTATTATTGADTASAHVATLERKSVSPTFS